MNAKLQELRRECKAYGRKELAYDVYCDRVNFIGENPAILSFCSRHNIVADPDRAGYSISIKDAQKLGLPMEKELNIIQCKDLRKKPF